MNRNIISDCLKNIKVTAKHNHLLIYICNTAGLIPAKSDKDGLIYKEMCNGV